MRILLATGSFAIGGTELQMARLARELHELGHEVAVWSLGESGPVAELLEEAGLTWEAGGWLITPPLLIPRNHESMPALPRRLVRLVGLPLRVAARAPRRRELRRRIEAFAPDVLHVYLPSACLGMLPRAQGVPVRVAGWRATRGSEEIAALSGRAWRTLVDNADAFVPNSSAIARELRSLPSPPRRVEVIRNGVDIPLRSADPSGSSPLGMVVANLSPEKGHAELITALGLLGSPPTVRLLGDGSERSALEAAARRAGLADTVIFEGQVENAADRYLDVQFAVLPSHAEGLPNAVLEAMAAGLPTIATDVGGVREVIEHEVDGLVVPPRDPGALAVAIERLVDDPELRCRLGAAARVKAAELSWGRCVERHLALYSELLELKAPVSSRAAGRTTA